MSLSLVSVDNKRHNLGDLFYSLFDITGDGAAPNGGYAISPNQVKMSSKIYGVELMGFPGAPPSMVGNVAWDNTNGKFNFLASRGPSIVVEETVVMTTNAGRLARIPGFIIAIQALAGGTTGTLRIIPHGKTTATKQVDVNFATGDIVTFATDAVTSVLVTYIPLGVGQFTAANLVVDEAHTFTTGGANLVNRAAMIQYVWNDTDATHLPKVLADGQAPATHQIAIKINNAGASTITPNAAQNTNTGLVTYFKFTNSWVSDHGWQDAAAITITSTTLFSFGKDLAIPPAGLFIPGFGPVIVGATVVPANLQGILEGPRGTAAANVIVYDPITGKMVPVVGDAYATITIPYCLITAADSPGSGGPVQTGTNLSGVTVRVKFIGL